ncbi:MAG: nucleotidyltransferase domain-containing protein [bacterium]|nr:nucleotidyltransferase domain-containing protein [bacterium]
MAKVSAKIREALVDYTTEINKICPLKKAILFGSYASSSSRKHSDIDLALFSNRVNDKNRLRLMTLFFTKTAKYKLDIQPILFSWKDYLDEENDFIREEIKKRGVEVYF